jgi:hypothetical protein
MSEHTNLKESNRKLMGILDDSQGAQFKYYNACNYTNNPIISLESLNIKGDVKSIKTSYFYMGEDDFQEGEYKESIFDSKGRIIKETTTKYDIDTKISTKTWKYEGDKLILSEIANGSNIFKTDFLYNEDILVGKKVRKDGNVNSFIHYIYGENVILEERYGSNSKIETRFKRGYNSKGQEIESVLSFNFFDNHHRYTNEYDEQGRLSKLMKRDCDNELTDSIEYAYNEQNDLIKTINSITNLILDYKYKYRIQQPEDIFYFLLSFPQEIPES